MRIVNVIEVLDNQVIKLKSFVVLDDQLSNEAYEKAEKYFDELVRPCISYPGIDVDELMESYHKKQEYRVDGHSVSIFWTYINEGEM